MVLGTVKLKHRNSTISASTRGRDVAEELTARKNITKEFTIVFFETTYIVNRNSKLAGPSRSASQWRSWHRKTTPTVYPEMNSRDVKNNGISHYTNRARMHRCDFDQTSKPQSQSKTHSTENQAKNVQNLFLFNKIKDGTLLPLIFKIVCCGGFRLQLMAICCNRRGRVNRTPSHATFFRVCAHL